MSMILPPDLESRIREEARRAGLSPEAWLRHQVIGQESKDYGPPTLSLQDQLTPEEWATEFHTWAESHDRNTPLLSDEAIARETIYPDRL